MKQRATLIREDLKTPRAAAVAGILFSVFLIAALILFRLSVRANPLEAGLWLKTSSNTVELGLSIYILIDNFRRAPEAPTSSEGRRPRGLGNETSG